MDRRLLGGVVAAAGLVLVALAVFADPIGIGGSDSFGYKQAIGAAVGGVAVVAGLALMYLPRRGEVAPGPEE